MTKKEYVLLVIEDNKSMAVMLSKTLGAEGYRVVLAGNAEEGLAAADREKVDLVLTDLKLPGMSGLEALKALKAKKPLLPIIIMTAFGSIETAVEAVKAGAYDFLTKPFDTSHMLVLVERALEGGRLAAENLVLKEEFAEILGFPKLVGESRALKDSFELIKKAAPTTTTVLLTGESGTGKELFARALHHLSPRSTGPFVAINCAAIPRDLLESELFGHEKGAFTGADTRRIGKFELADNGTVFLDEVGEMDMSLQAKLLRVLQGERIERVGGTEPLLVDMRLVAASNRDLTKAVKDGSFREDLYYRLNVFPVRVPPLRERTEDIPALAQYFAEKHSRKMKKSLAGVSPSAIKILAAQQWKGNVRELENCIERAVILADGPEIGPEQVGFNPDAGRETPADGSGGRLFEIASRAAREAEIHAIGNALGACQGNKTKASEMLGVSYKTLLTKIRDYGIG
ncbi:MAG: sigma-54 dependent transcriptional regulator [Nitrospirota bacterium]